MADSPPKEDPTLNDVVAGTTDPQPSDDKPSIDPTEFERLQGVEAEHKKVSGFMEALRGAGVQSADDLRESLTLIKNMKAGGDDFTKVVQGLLEGDKSKGTKPVEAKTEALTAEDVKGLIKDALTQTEAARAEQTYNEQAGVEETLKARVFSDERFAHLFKDKEGKPISFNDAWLGKAGPVAQNLAVIADHMFYERGRANQTGEYRPVVDPSAVAEVADQLATMYKELKAATILEASVEPNEASEVSGEGVKETMLTGSPFTTDEAARDKFDAEVTKTVEKVAKQIGAARKGLPLSGIGL
jgi:hypothetical protein